MIKINLYFTISLTLCFNAFFGQQNSIEGLASSVMAQKTFNKMHDRLLAINDSFSHVKSYTANFYYFDTLLHKAQKANNKKLEGIIWTSKGNFYLQAGNYSNSIGSFRKSISIFEPLKDYSGLANSYTNMGNTYFYLFNYEKALLYYKMAVGLCKKITDTTSNVNAKLANLYNNLGSVYCSQNDFVYGKTYFGLAYKIWVKTKDSLSISYVFNNYAQIFMEAKQLDSAEIYYTKALNLKLKFGDIADKADGYKNLAMLKFKKGSSAASLEYVRKALSYLDTNSYSRQLIHCYQILNIIYNSNKDYKNELKYYKLYTAANDSANSKDQVSHITRMEMQFEFDKIHLSDSIKSLEEIKLKDQKITEKKTQSYFLIFILVLTLLALSLIYSRFKMAKKQKQVIEQKNKEITDSINYAKKIQQSILPNENFIEKEIKRLVQRKTGE